MLNGASTLCNQRVVLEMNVGGVCFRVKCIVAKELVTGCEVILGMDSIKALGGVSVIGQKVRFGASVGLCGSMGVEESSVNEEERVVIKGDQVKEEASKSGGVGDLVRLEEVDFSAEFQDGKWKVWWKWKDAEPELRNQKGEYHVNDDIRPEYEKEVEQWIADGWLKPYDEQEHGRVSGIIPLMAVAQPQKGKVRPVMDYRELNEYVESQPGRDVAVCDERLREWRRMGTDVCLLDLKKAYLQLHVAEELQKFQRVRYKGDLFVMTRMGFGLTSAPKIMSCVLKKVLSLDPQVKEGTDSYVDDVICNLTVISPQRVQDHLLKYGLITKDPVPLDGARVLGLRVREKGSGYEWERDGGPQVAEDGPITRRQLFSTCGKLTGHYPVAGWLRVACSFLKREACACTSGWDSCVSEPVRNMLAEIIERVSAADPVKGRWDVSPTKKGRVWCDASSIALGALVDVDGVTAEDACWLRKKGDGSHINVAELEAVIKGLNLGLAWGLRDIEVMCDSATVCGWLSSVIVDSHRPRVCGLSEMLVKRRLSIVADLIDAYSLKLEVVYVRSHMNKADSLTRVNKKWLRNEQLETSRVAAVGAVTAAGAEVCSSPDENAIRDSHNLHHMGVSRTLYFVKVQYGDGDYEQMVKSVVDSCEMCQSIDPAPVRWTPGSLQVSSSWLRVAADVVHHAGIIYLSLVDCGPGRYAIWRRLHSESGDAVVRELQSIFRERGPFRELLTDNGPCFRSSAVASLLQKWKVAHLYSCVYRPSGNGIVERNHRTIKRMAARTGKPIEDVLPFYNGSPNSAGVIPFATVHAYSPRVPGVDEGLPESKPPEESIFKEGDVVYVKPPVTRCTTVWPKKVISRVLGRNCVEIDNRPHHVRDIRLAERAVLFHAADEACSPDSNVSSDVELEFVEPTVDIVEPVHDEAFAHEPTQRDRRPPQWMEDFYVY